MQLQEHSGLSYSRQVIRLLPILILVPLLLEFATEGNGVNVKDAVNRGLNAIAGFPHGVFFWSILTLSVGVVLWFLHPLHVYWCSKNAIASIPEKQARKLMDRLDNLGAFIIALSTLASISGSVLDEKFLTMDQFLPRMYTVLESASTGLMIGVVLWLIIDNSLFLARRRIVTQYPTMLPRPNSIFQKVFAIILVMVLFLVFQVFATSGYFLRRGIAISEMGPEQLKAFLGDQGTSPMGAFLPGSNKGGIDDTLMVFYLRTGIFLLFVLQITMQIKFMIKKPIEVIASRLYALQGGQAASSKEIQIFQNDEYTKVYLAINALIRKQDRELEVSRDQLDSITESAADPIIVYDQDQVLKVFNPAAEDYFGVPARVALGKTLSAVVLIEDDEGSVCSTARSLCPGEDGAGCSAESLHGTGPSPGLRRFHARRSDGRVLHFEAHARSIECENSTDYTVILRDIQAQLDIEENLRKAKQAAENANRMKSEFLATMSHELRTPLNAVLGFTQLLSTDRNLTTSQLERVATISRSGEHLLALINDILDISKIEAGKVDLHVVPFDLEQFVADVKDMFELKCKKKGLSLDLEHIGELPRYIEADLGKLRQVVINLVGNAVKFTSEGGIGIRVGRDNGLLRFSVIDSGRGIPDEEKDAILQPFIQSSVTDHEGGTGLGLAISSRFIDMMGGKLEVQSELGKGSTFSFAIPVLETDAQPELEIPEQIPLAVKAGHEVRVLVVDDKLTNRLVLKEMLEMVGFTVFEAENGREAVDRCLEFRPEIVFMDIRMPQMDGYDAVTAIRADDRIAGVKVFALTASAFRHDEERIIATGFDGFLAKPFKRASLFQLIRQKTSVEMLYETARPADIAQVDPETLDYGSCAALLGDEALGTLEMASLINDFTGVRKFADSLAPDLAPLAQILRSYAGAFDEAGLGQVLTRLRQKG